MADAKPTVTLHLGDCLEALKAIPDRSARCCVTSPPYYGLRDYGVDGQIGLEATPDAYVGRLVEVFREVRRVLADDGTLWLNLGDSYAGSSQSGQNNLGASPFSTKGGAKKIDGKRFDIPRAIPEGLKPKDLIGAPWRVAFALQADGWYLRSDIIWHKPNPMPESIKDRPTKSHEYVFLMSKQERYFYDADAAKEAAVGKSHHDLTGCGYRPPGQAPSRGNRKALHGPTYSRHRSSIPGGQSLQATPDGRRNRRSVWTVATRPCKEAHFAVMPDALVEPCILAGSEVGDAVIDPFAGAGTTGMVAARWGRSFIGIELNPDYLAIARRRIDAERDKTRLFEGIANG